MEIKRTQKEEQTSLISVKVGEKDYGEAVEKSLRDYRRKANIPGFRPGMVPMGIIKKMYGKGVVAEQSYRTASNAVFEYLQKENIDYLGDVIPAEEQGAFDFDNDTEFEYMFEIGEAPKIDLALSAKDKVTYHRIKIDKQMHDNYRSNFLRRYGRLVDVEKVADDEALTVTLDNGELRVEDAYVGLISMNDEERKPFKGKKVGAKMKVDINELYKRADYITIHIHYTKDTERMIDAKAIGAMKRGVRFINLARGEIVDDDAMLAALDTGWVAAYVTDFPNNRLVGAPHVLAMPHLGASTPESEQNCAVMAVDQLRDYLENGNIRNSVNLPAVSQERSGVCRLCLIHKNVPAMLASITTLLSRDGINVENLSNKSRGDYAYTIVDLSAPADQCVIDEVTALENVIRVRVIQ